MTEHAKALLLAFRSGWPVFETTALQSVPVMDTPLSLRDGATVTAAFDELAALGLVKPWSPDPGANPDKPHPQLPLRCYWPAGRIWVLA